MPQFHKSRDLPQIAFLVTQGFECIGTVPTEQTNKRGQVIKEYVIEYDDSKENELENAIADYEQERTPDARYAKEFYKAQKTVKHYLDDDKK
jgi:hypothetical protein